MDLNLRKNWQASLQHEPDVIVFLGDMMDNGRSIISDEELVSDVYYFSVDLTKGIVFRYETYYQRFRSIFKAYKNVPQYFIPGNHDIGYVRFPFSVLSLLSAQTSN